MSILSPFDIADLEASGLVTPVLPDGTRQLHRRRLNATSDAEYANLPLTPISLESPAQDSSLFATIPVLFESQATLKYIGCTDETAARIWWEWGTWRNGRKTEDEDAVHGTLFIEFAVLRLTRKTSIDVDADCEDDRTWRNCLTECGINAEVQETIMDPMFKELRLTESCFFWIKDTIKLRYRELVGIHRASCARAIALVRAQLRALRVRET
ncbi:hypothetical protein F5Y04DRAFT_280590 [Hypomontagnella monticulosa]|nr:hypothetical protein F5Y04DRAFT_280590 [Hypomontagnella monticulosa]